MSSCENEVIKFLKSLLNKCNITFESFNMLDGVMIPRDILLDNEKMKYMENDIKQLKKIFSSSSMTSLHKNATTKQKFPLLNLVRQTLRLLNYKMEPIRKSDGYTKDGKKIFVRYFKIIKNKSNLQSE